MMRVQLHKIDEALKSAIHRMRSAEEGFATYDEPYMRGQAQGIARARRELVRVSELLVYALEDARSIDAIAAREERAIAAELAESDHD